MKNESVQNDEVSVSKKISVEVAGRSIVVSLLKMGEHEGMTVGQAAELFGVDSNTVKEHVKNHGLMIAGISSDHLKVLKSLGVIPLKSARANFLPRETIRQLVRHIGTPEAQAAYDHLWAMADDGMTFLKTQAEVHSTDPIDIAEMLLNTAKVERAMRIEAERLKEIADKRAFSAMGSSGANSRAAAKEKARADEAEKYVEFRKLKDAIYAAQNDFCNLTRIDYRAFGSKLEDFTLEVSGKRIRHWTIKDQSNLKDLHISLSCAQAMVNCIYMKAGQPKKYPLVKLEYTWPKQAGAAS